MKDVRLCSSGVTIVARQGDSHLVWFAQDANDAHRRRSMQMFLRSRWACAASLVLIGDHLSDRFTGLGGPFFA